MKNHICSAVVLLGFAVSLRAQMSVGAWTPLFKGIDHAIGTNWPNGSTPISSQQSVNCLRVDLSDPDIQFFTTPKASGYVAEQRETLSLSISNFLKHYALQVAVDANFYDANPGGADPLSEGVPCEVYGLQICTGAVVSVQDYQSRYASILFTTNKQPSLVWSNAPPGTNITGIYTAVTGYYPVLTNGINVWSLYSNQMSSFYYDTFIHGPQPRTGMGLSQDRRYLYLVTIDGRQDGYSAGAYDSDTGRWLQQFGAWDGISMDGGGSTALYMADCVGNPVPVNHSSYVAAYGRERYIGSHLGVYAQPLPGFISDMTVTPGSSTALINWTTAAGSSSQVQYGRTPGYGQITALDTNLVTSHSVTLDSLAPTNTYYFQVLSQVGALAYSNGCYFSTTNPAGFAYGSIVPVTYSWKYSYADLDGAPWQSTGYSDAGWSSGPGLLWVDTGSGGPSPDVSPRGTQMPNTVDPSTGNPYPYITYYFRTHFTNTLNPATMTLVFSNFVDDGAIFYLNGAELFRVHMNPAPFVYSNSTVAAGFSCSNFPTGGGQYGNATTNCPEMVYLSGSALANLSQGDNVLAVEVHNYSAHSPDITFGSGLYYSAPLPVPVPPFITNVMAAAGETNATLSWNTLSNSTSQVEYGPTTALGTFTVLNPTLTTNHSVTLTGLQAVTPYYYRVISSWGGTQYTADSNFMTGFFYTGLMPITNTWRFTTNDLDTINWQATGYDDSTWIGSGQALLHYDDNVAVTPRNTVLPIMANNLPWMTYYFRTKLVATNNPAGFDLLFSNYVNAGAVFYLNGTEIHRLRMPAAPAVITNQTWATGLPPGGDATQADVFQIGGNLMTNWVVGTNYLAAEVHKALPSGTRVVFGSSMGFVRMPVTEARLRMSVNEEVVCIAWDGTGFTLQQAHDLKTSGSWSDVPGPVTTSPYCVTNPVTTTFYRLRN